MALRKVQSGVIADNAITSTKIASGTTVSPTQLTTEINNLIASAPGALNTLDELAAALGDDANYAATITTALGTKANTSSLGPLATLSPTGTASSSTFLAGDGSYKTVSVTPTAISDQANTSTGYFDLPSGTTDQRPASPHVGMTRFNTTINAVEGFHANDGWLTLSNNFQATGGSVGTYSSGGNNYQHHTFTSSGTFTVQSGSKLVDVFLVAGGGGGGNGSPSNDGNGGGGAGGVLYQLASYTAPAGNYAITVGAGGAGGPAASGGIGVNGNNTIAFGFTAVGGGGGGTDTPSVGSGGSGGGASCSGTYGGVRAGGSGTSGQGNAGGGALNGAGPGGGGGGGGGAGATGGQGNGSGSVGGSGGIGAIYALDNNSLYYAGGGGGSSWNNAGGPGGLGGGGGGGGTTSSVSGGGSSRNTGSSSSGRSGGAAGANTGGGGGSANNGGSAGQGGSGIVIIRYTV